MEEEKNKKKDVGFFFGLLFYAYGIIGNMNEYGQLFFIVVGSMVMVINK